MPMAAASTSCSIRRASASFRALVNWCVEFRWTTIGATLAFALGVYGFKFIEQFFPDSSRPELMVEMWTPEGTTFAANEAQVKKFEAFIRQQEGVVSVTSYVGTGAALLPAAGPDFPADQRVADRGAAQGSAGARRLRDKIVDVFKQDFPEVRGRVKLLPNGPPVPYPVQFRVTGTKWQGARDCRSGQGHHARQSEHGGRQRQLERVVKVLRLDLDQDKMRALGVTSQTVMRAANTILSGTTIGQFREGIKLIDIVMRQPSRSATPLPC
jgi:multidrug efflux pump subunit AcrB